MTDETEDPRDPFRDATPRQALVAIAMIFVIGLVLGFVLGRTL
jgi:LPS O-antigen subunit length determinant protein (WzzB/FepE family)